MNRGDSCAAAVSEEDVEGNPRVQHCRVDMGGYESSVPPAEMVGPAMTTSRPTIVMSSRERARMSMTTACRMNARRACQLSGLSMMMPRREGDGTNWAGAFTHLQDALAVAAAGSEVHVAGRGVPAGP